MHLHKRIIAQFGVLAALAGAAFPSTARGQADVQGVWSPVQNWPIVAVHAALMPTGKVVFYPYGDDSRIWDPATNAITTAAKVGYNIFCTGHSQMADGRLFVTGGHVVNGQGLNDASIYDPFTNSWARLPDMNNGRWYPSQVTLANGDHLTISGSYNANYANNQLPQVWQTATNSWRNLTGAQRGLDLYPGMHLAPNGSVFIAIPSTTSLYLDTSGTGAWATVGNRTGPYRGYGSSVLYDDGKVLAVGGADPPTASAEVIDLNAPTPSWRSVASMSAARRQMNATIMADGRVLVTGGSSAPGFNEPAGAVLYAESWNPDTEQWSSMAGYTQYRGYHSTALLLPDGRVLSAGGDNHPNAEVFSPPYLYKGARPTITSAPPSAANGETIFIGTPEASVILKVHLIRIGSVTHATNMDQRINRLAFSQAPGGINATVPLSANLCPPGYYLLFVLNGDGVPSVASMLRVGGAVAQVPSAPTGLSANVVSRTQIDLAWTDNAGNESGFKVDQSRNGTDWTQVGTTGANMANYSATGLRKNTIYYFRVRAHNAAGNSGYSNTATARTQR